MFRNILLPTDGSPLSMIAVQKGLLLARDAGAKVLVLTVSPPFHVFSTDAEQISETKAEYERRSHAHASGILSDVEMQAKDQGVACEVMQLDSDTPYKVIVDVADKRGCDLIAMASHGRRGITAVLLGSETMKVLTHSAVPVLVYR